MPLPSRSPRQPRRRRPEGCGRRGSAWSAGAAAELDAVGVVLGVEVADGQLDRGVVGVEVEAVDAEQGLADVAAEVRGGERGGAGRADALLGGGDGAPLASTGLTGLAGPKLALARTALTGL